MLNIKYDVTICISKTQFLPALVLQINLGLTLSQYPPSLERNANHIRPIPTQLPPNSTFSHSCSAAGSHDLSPVPDVICGLGLEADGASLPLCCFRRRVQPVQQFSESRKSSSRGTVPPQISWLDRITEGKENLLGHLLKMKGSEATETLVFSWMNFEESAS